MKYLKAPGLLNIFNANETKLYLSEAKINEASTKITDIMKEHKNPTIELVQKEMAPYINALIETRDAVYFNPSHYIRESIDSKTNGLMMGLLYNDLQIILNKKLSITKEEVYAYSGPDYIGKAIDINDSPYITAIEIERDAMSKMCIEPCKTYISGRKFCMDYFDIYIGFGSHYEKYATVSGNDVIKDILSQFAMGAYLLEAELLAKAPLSYKEGPYRFFWDKDTNAEYEEWRLECNKLSIPEVMKESTWLKQKLENGNIFIIGDRNWVSPKDINIKDIRWNLGPTSGKYPWGGE